MSERQASPARLLLSADPLRFFCRNKIKIRRERKQGEQPASTLLLTRFWISWKMTARYCRRILAMLHLLPRPSTARSRSSSTAQERALGRICAGKGLSVSRGWGTKGDAGRVGALLSAPRHGHQAELPLGTQQEGEQLGPGGGTPSVGTPGALPSSPKPGWPAPRIKGSCPRPALPFGEGQGAHSRPLPRSPGALLGRCPRQFHKPQGKDAAVLPRDSRSAFLQAPAASQPQSFPAAPTERGKPQS